MPLFNPKEYQALKAGGLINIVKLPNEKIRVTNDRCESEDYDKAAILSWLAHDRKTLTDQVEVLDTIKADIDPL